MTRTAITGSPGCGKTTLAGLLRADGHAVVDLKQWARDTDCIVGHDDADDADVIDLDALADHVADLPDDCFIEGHLAHLLPFDAAWVIRVDPDVLRGRLEARGYAAAKVVENLEAEALDIILMEALDEGAVVVQRDGTTRTPAALLSSFTEGMTEAAKGGDLEPVDWSHRLPIS